VFDGRLRDCPRRDASAVGGPSCSVWHLPSVRPGVVARDDSQVIGPIHLITDPKATTTMTEETVGVSSQLPLTDRQPEVQQIRAPALGRWFKSPPALAGISYGIAWVAGLAAWPSNLAIDASKREIVSIYAAHTSHVLASTTFVSLPVLILWVASTGIWLGAESQRRLHAHRPRGYARAPAPGPAL
jgi:hypothetical protein